MPVSGKFLVCQKPEIIEQNRNKVYGRAALGAPPMSVPHLDWRTIYGQDCIFFGPFAGFSPTLFKVGGSWFDWLSTFNPRNVAPTAFMAVCNLPLVKYLVTEVFSSKEQQLAALREFVPDARPEDWTMVSAGQRIQVRLRARARVRARVMARVRARVRVRVRVRVRARARFRVRATSPQSQP